MTTPGPAKPLADLLRGPGPNNYASQTGTGAWLESVDPVTGWNKVTDGSVQYTDLPSLVPYADLFPGRVLLMETPGLPVILNRLYSPLPRPVVVDTTTDTSASQGVADLPGTGSVGGSSSVMDDATLIWSDEFVGSSLSLATDTGGGTWRTKGYEAGGSLDTGYTDFAGSSWNVSPGQHPAAFPVTVSGSVLTITAKRNPGLAGVTNSWVGAYLVTNHLTNLRWRFGYFEWRAQVPNTGRGMFPALWLFNNMAGRSDGKEGAEIDMFEVFGEPDGLPWSSGWHNNPTPGVSGNAGNFSTDSAGWHRYGIDWTPTTITYYRDGVQIAQLTGTNAEWFATADMGIRINYAMDPNWLAAGDPNKSTSSDPASGIELQLKVDYVRVFNRRPTTLPLGSDDPMAVGG